MLSGHCECGRIRYQVDTGIKDFSHCHCSQCRRLHGAAYATFAGVARDDFRYLSGESDISVYASSERNELEQTSSDDAEGNELEQTSSARSPVWCAGVETSGRISTSSTS